MTSYRKTHDYGVEEICRLLRVVDLHLSAPASVVILGGAAAAFHRARSTTTDIDTQNAIDEVLELAIVRAKAETELDIPIGQSSIADYPYHFEDRVERQLPELSVTGRA